MSIHYTTDERISSDVFFGRKVPGPTTIDEDTHENLLTRADRTINRFIRIKKSEANDPDEYGDLEEIAIRLYKDMREGKDPVLTTEEKRTLLDHGYHREGGHALVSHDMGR